jgi:hypothetical protein
VPRRAPRDYEESDLVAICAALERRVDDCWERLQDAAVELAHVHEVPVEEIADRITQAVAAEDEPEAQDGG